MGLDWLWIGWSARRTACTARSGARMPHLALAARTRVDGERPTPIGPQACTAWWSRSRSPRPAELTPSLKRLDALDHHRRTAGAADEGLGGGGAPVATGPRWPEPWRATPSAAGDRRPPSPATGPRNWQMEVGLGGERQGRIEGASGVVARASTPRLAAAAAPAGTPGAMSRWTSGVSSALQTQGADAAVHQQVSASATSTSRSTYRRQTPMAVLDHRHPRMLGDEADQALAAAGWPGRPGRPAVTTRVRAPSGRVGDERHRASGRPASRRAACEAGGDRGIAGRNSDPLAAAIALPAFRQRRGFRGHVRRRSSRSSPSHRMRWRSTTAVRARVATSPRPADRPALPPRAGLGLSHARRIQRQLDPAACSRRVQSGQITVGIRRQDRHPAGQQLVGHGVQQPAPPHGGRDRRLRLPRGKRQSTHVAGHGLPAGGRRRPAGPGRRDGPGLAVTKPRMDSDVAAVATGDARGLGRVVLRSFARQRAGHPRQRPDDRRGEVADHLAQPAGQ